MFAGSFAGCWCWWLSWIEGAVEAAGQVEILKWVSDVVGQCHPGQDRLRPNGSLTVLDLATIWILTVCSSHDTQSCSPFLFNHDLGFSTSGVHIGLRHRLWTISDMHECCRNLFRP